MKAKTLARGIVERCSLSGFTGTRRDSDKKQREKEGKREMARQVGSAHPRLGGTRPTRPKAVSMHPLHNNAANHMRAEVGGGATCMVATSLRRGDGASAAKTTHMPTVAERAVATQHGVVVASVVAT